MAKILPELLSFPPETQVANEEYDRQATKFANKILGLPAASLRETIDDKSLLEALDPAVNTIPYMCCLIDALGRAANNHNQALGLIPWTVDFFQQFDPIQVRYAGKLFRDLFALTAEAYMALNVPDVRPLGQALLRLDPSAGTFTTSHLVYLRLCLQSGQAQQALPIVDKDIHSFPLKVPQTLPEDVLLADEHEFSNVYISAKTDLGGKLSAEVVLEYYLLSAHVYIGSRRWSRAQLCLELVILHPSAGGATSAFQVEAYKKHILIALLVDGRVKNTTWASSQQVMKNITAIAKPYDTLAETFRLRQWRKFQAEKSIGAAIWQQDGNAGMVDAVSDSLLRYCVLDLKKTYAALPVTRIASHLDLAPDQTLKLLQDMITEGQIEGQLDESDGGVTLRFAQDKAGVVDDVAIETQTKRIHQLLQYVNDASKRLQLSKEYIDVTRRAMRQGADGDPADQMDLEWNNAGGPVREATMDLADENIMA